jgi:hypothetical protein
MPEASWPVTYNAPFWPLLTGCLKPSLRAERGNPVEGLLPVEGLPAAQSRCLGCCGPCGAPEWRDSVNCGLFACRQVTGCALSSVLCYGNCKLSGFSERQYSKGNTYHERRAYRRIRRHMQTATEDKEAVPRTGFCRFCKACPLSVPYVSFDLWHPAGHACPCGSCGRASFVR